MSRAKTRFTQTKWLQEERLNHPACQTVCQTQRCRPLASFKNRGGNIDFSISARKAGTSTSVSAKVKDQLKAARSPHRKVWCKNNNNNNNKTLGGFSLFGGASFHVGAAPPTAHLTFVGTGDPLQRGDVVVVLADREGENTDLPERSHNEPLSSRRRVQKGNEPPDEAPLTVLLGQLYFSKMSCARSSPPSVNIIIILLQLALGALLSWERTEETGTETG